MMNLEVLFQSEELTGNHTLREIAISHADTTMKNHIRADGMRSGLSIINDSLNVLFRWNLARCGIQFDHWLRRSEGDSPRLC
jgi:hypothetical protein